MKITKVTYQKAFIIGPYLQEKVGFEAEITHPFLDAADGKFEIETPEMLLSRLKEMADKWHISQNPPLDGSDLHEHMKTKITFVNGQTPYIDYKQIESWEAEIDDCITLEQLEQWVKTHETFPGKLLPIINERRSALKTST